MTNPSEAVELLPCPNPWCCTKNAPLPGNGPAGWRVYCGCGVKTYARPTIEEAKAEWNRRADHPPQAEGEAVAWRKWLPIGAPPMDGQWFAARAPVGQGWQVRVVHYADRHDRLPIDHSGLMWEAEPTEWLPLFDFTRLYAQQAATASNTTAGYEAEGVVDQALSAPQQGVEAVREKVAAFEDWLNEPPTRDRTESPDARDYRHDTYRRWEPLCRAVLAALRPSPDSGGSGFHSGPQERPSIPTEPAST